MTNEFKVGDKVKLIYSDGLIWYRDCQDKIGTIIKINPSGSIRVEWSNGVRYYYNCFTLSRASVFYAEMDKEGLVL